MKTAESRLKSILGCIFLSVTTNGQTSNEPQIVWNLPINLD